MPAQLPKPETQEYHLMELDERQGIPTDEKTTVTVRLATVRQNSIRSRLFSEYVRELPDPTDDRGERLIFKLPFYDLAAKEVYLTMVGCNIMKGEEPLFRFKSGPNGSFLDMTEKQFEEAWGLLDDETASEIHSKVLDMNKHWLLGQSLEDASLGEV